MSKTTKNKTNDVITAEKGEVHAAQVTDAAGSAGGAKSGAKLKELFARGKTPTADDFAALIDSFADVEDAKGIKNKITGIERNVKDIETALSTEISAIKKAFNFYLCSYTFAPFRIKTPRHGHSSVVTNGKLYIIGGVDEQGNVLKDVEIYNIYDGLKFETVQVTLKTARYGHSSFVSGDKLYVIGGKINGVKYHTNGATNEIEIYNIHGGLNFETVQVTLKTARYNHSSVVSGDKLYVIGGQTTSYDKEKVLDDVEIYNIHDGLKFETVQVTLKTARYNHSSFVSGNKLYVIGGVDKDKKVVNVVETYDIRDDGLESEPVQELKIQKASYDHSSFGGNIQVPEVQQSRMKMAVTIDQLRQEMKSYYTPLDGSFAIAVADKNYMLVGQNSYDDMVEIIIISGNAQIRSKVSLNLRKKLYCSSVVLDSKIYLIGGYRVGANKNEYPSAVEVINLPPFPEEGF